MPVFAVLKIWKASSVGGFLLFLCLSLLPSLNPSFALAWPGKVVGITDGDTIKVLKLPEKEEIKIRLYGIDCPERGQAFGKRAKQTASALVYGKMVEIEQIDIDRYGRVVANVILPEGQVMNAEMIKQGLAWVYPKYCLREECAEWKELESEARARKLGLFADPHAVPPWEWRREK